jgi:HAD superfamily hydrolase (TIGR01509 family)
MDGVLIDSHPVHKRAWRKFFDSLGLTVSDEQLDFVLDGRKKEDILRHFLGDLPEAQIKRYGREKEMLFREEALSIDLVDGALEFLEELTEAGIGFALASCGSKSRVNYILRQLKIHDRFAAIITADDVQCGKPDPDIFRKAADRLGSSYSDLLVCEDAISGVQAAKAAGIRCLGIADHARADELLDAGADRVIANFACTSLPQIKQMFD